MSGQPCKTPSDAQKYRDAYMANLNLQIKNDDKNLQANKLHQRTGVVATQISDYRTTSEKLADVETLKALVRKELSQICDSINCQAIVQKLSADELRFVAQNIDMFVKDLKPKNKFGVLEPVFRSYLATQMNSAIKAEANSMGLMLENKGVESLAMLKQLESQVISSADIAEGIRKIKSRENNELVSKLGYLAEQVIDKLNILTQQFYRRIETIPDFKERLEALQNVARAIRELPSREQFHEKINAVLRAHRGDERDELIAEVAEILDVPSLQFLEKTEQEIPRANAGSFSDPRELLKDLKFKKNDILKIIEPYVELKSYEDLFGMSKSAFNKLTIPQMLDRVRSIMGELVNIYEEEMASIREEGEKGGDALGYEFGSNDVFTRSTAPKSRDAGDIGHMGGEENSPMDIRRHVMHRSAERKKDEAKAIARLNEIGAKQTRQRSATQITKVIRKKATSNRRLFEHEEEPVVGHGLPFGKYYLNPHKIKDDIVSIQTKAGRNHPQMPTKRVSKGLGAMIRHIAGGGNPSYEDLHKMSEADRSHLSDLVRRCKVDVDVPEGDDKNDLDQFEIMQGEIGSGNDSPELIKKFKMVILRLMNKGRLPKGQAREILSDLVALGY